MEQQRMGKKDSNEKGRHSVLKSLMKLCIRTRGKGDRFSGLLSESFRKIKEDEDEEVFSLEFKDDLREKLSEKEPPEGIPYYNILLLGQAASGKSSFVNTVCTAVANDGRIHKPFAVLINHANSVTCKLQAEPLKYNPNGCPLPVRIFDCRGLHKVTGLSLEDIKKIVKGHIRPGYKFNPEESIKEDDECYRHEPELKDTIHCLVYVLKGDNPAEAFTDDTVKQQFDNMLSDLSKINVPQMALVTMMDRVGRDSLEHIFRSKSVKKVCEGARDFLRLPMFNIFPMSSYFEEMNPTTVKDTLALFNLNAMMNQADDYLRSKLRIGAPQDFDN